MSGKNDNLFLNGENWNGWSEFRRRGASFLAALRRIFTSTPKRLYPSLCLQKGIFRIECVFIAYELWLIYEIHFREFFLLKKNFFMIILNNRYDL